MSGFTSLWQRIHFNVFRFNKFAQLNVVGLPVLLFLRNKHVKKSYQKRGVADPEKLVRRTLVDPKGSTIVWLTDGFMCILIALVIFIIANLLSAVFRVVLMGSLNYFVFMAACLIPSFYINYLLLWKNGRYLGNFKKFENETRQEKRKWAWISFGIVAGIVLLLILSFFIMSWGIHRVDES